MSGGPLPTVGSAPSWPELSLLAGERSESLPVARNPVALGQPEFLDADDPVPAASLVALLNPFAFDAPPPTAFDGRGEIGPRTIPRAAEYSAPSPAAERVSLRPPAEDPWRTPLFDDGDAEIRD